MGEPILIEGVERSWTPHSTRCCRSSIFQRGSQKMIKLGTEEVTYDDNFHLLHPDQAVQPALPA